MDDLSSRFGSLVGSTEWRIKFKTKWKLRVYMSMSSRAIKFGGKWESKHGSKLGLLVYRSM